MVGEEGGGGGGEGRDFELERKNPFLRESTHLLFSDEMLDYHVSHIFTVSISLSIKSVNSAKIITTSIIKTD